MSGYSFHSAKHLSLVALPGETVALLLYWLSAVNSISYMYSDVRHVATYKDGDSLRAQIDAENDRLAAEARQETWHSNDDYDGSVLLFNVYSRKDCWVDWNETHRISQRNVEIFCYSITCILAGLGLWTHLSSVASTRLNTHDKGQHRRAMVGYHKMLDTLRRENEHKFPPSDTSHAAFEARCSLEARTIATRLLSLKWLYWVYGLSVTQLLWMGVSVLVVSLAGPSGDPSPHCSEYNERLNSADKAVTYYASVSEAFLFLMFFAWLIARCAIAVVASKCMVELGAVEAKASLRVRPVGTQDETGGDAGPRTPREDVVAGFVPEQPSTVDAPVKTPQKHPPAPDSVVTGRPVN